MKTRPIVQLYANAKKLNYKSEPVYYIGDPHQSVCFYEIYVNDILVYKLYENVATVGNYIALNDVILKSGTQKVTVKLYPATDINGKPFNNLSKNTSFDLKIEMYDIKKKDADDVVVKHYFASTTTGKKDGPFKFAGTPYFEDTFTFEAEVPYTLKGWSESQDLTKMDKEVLEQEVLDFYTAYDKVIQSQDEEKWVKMVQNEEQEYFKSIAYNNRDDSSIKDRIKEYSNFMDSELIKAYPLDKYKMVLWGDGKVVTLRSLEFPGESAYTFGRMIDSNGERIETRSSRYLYIHKPKGSSKFEIIRL